MQGLATRQEPDSLGTDSVARRRTNYPALAILPKLFHRQAFESGVGDLDRSSILRSAGRPHSCRFSFYVEELTAVIESLKQTD